MARNYEEAWKLQEQLEEAERRLSDAIASGTPYADMADLFDEVEELQEKMAQFDEDDF